MAVVVWVLPRLANRLSPIRRCVECKQARLRREQFNLQSGIRDFDRIKDIDKELDEMAVMSWSACRMIGEGRVLIKLQERQAARKKEQKKNE